MKKYSTLVDNEVESTFTTFKAAKKFAITRAIGLAEYTGKPEAVKVQDSLGNIKGTAIAYVTCKWRAN